MNHFTLAELDSKKIAQLRGDWNRRPAEWDSRSEVRWRDIRFVSTDGFLSASESGTHYRRLAQLIEGTLPEGVAPGVPFLGMKEVSGVSRHLVDWTVLTDREWRALHVAGLSTVRRFELLSPAGDALAAPSTEEQTRDRERALVEQLFAALGVTDAELGPTMDAVTRVAREARLSRALDATAGHRGNAARLLGVSHVRVSQMLAEFPHLAERWPGASGRPL